MGEQPLKTARRVGRLSRKSRSGRRTEDYDSMTYLKRSNVGSQADICENESGLLLSNIGGFPSYERLGEINEQYIL